MRAAADTVLKSVGLAGVDYVFIAKKRTFGAVWLDLVCEATAGVSFLNNKVFQCEKRQSV
jgi:hypothetical protein